MKNLLVLLIVGVFILGCSTACRDKERPKPTQQKGSFVMERSVVGFGSCEWNLKVRIGMASFSTAEGHKIEQAMLNWNKASGGRICFIVEWVGMDQNHEGRNWVSDDVTTLYAGHVPWQRRVSTTDVCKKVNECAAVTIWPLSGQYADVFYFSHEPGRFRSLTEHELGHVIGLSHLPHPDALMYGEAVGGPNITKYDLAALQCVMRHKAVGQYHNPCRVEDKK